MFPFARANPTNKSASQPTLVILDMCSENKERKAFFSSRKAQKTRRLSLSETSFYYVLFVLLDFEILKQKDLGISLRSPFKTMMWGIGGVAGVEALVDLCSGPSTLVASTKLSYHPGINQSLFNLAWFRAPRSLWLPEFVKASHRPPCWSAASPTHPWSAGLALHSTADRLELPSLNIHTTFHVSLLKQAST